MANIDVKQIKVAKRYAEALFENSNVSNKLQLVFDNLKLIESVLNENSELKSFLENPVISHSDKKDVISEIFNEHVDESVKNLLFLLIDNNRFDLFFGVLIAYSNKLDETNNILKVKVISAVEVSEELKNALVQKLENKVSKKVVPEYEIKPEIIAGLIIEVSDKTIDTSLKTKLNNLKKQLI